MPFRHPCRVVNSAGNILRRRGAPKGAARAAAWVEAAGGGFPDDSR